jgi:hypothetical protein
METGNPLKRSAARIILGAKERTVLISNCGLRPFIKKMTPFSQPHYSNTPVFHHSSAMGNGKAVEL